MQGTIEFPVYRKVGTLLGILGCEFLVDVDANSGLISGMHEAVLEEIGVGKDLVGLRRVRNVFLDSEVVDAEIEMKGSAHADWAEVGRAMTAGAHLVKLREVSNLSQVRDAASVNNGGSDVVDQLLLYELLAIEDRVEYFADRNWSCGVLANNSEAFL